MLAPNVVGRTAAAIETKMRQSGGHPWNEESFRAEASSRCSAEEMALVDALLDDATRRGVKLSWGAGVSAGVCGWYQVAGRPTGVWILQTGRGDAGPPRLELRLGGVVQRLADAEIGLERIEAACRHMESIPAVAGKIGLARAAGWIKYPQFLLRQLVAYGQAVERVLETVRKLADPSDATTSDA